MSGMQIRIQDVLYVVMKRWRIILALAVVGLFVGFAVNGISYMQTGNNNANVWCNVAVTAQGADGKYPENRSIPASGDYTEAESMAEAAAYILTSYGVRENAISSAGLKNSVDNEVFGECLTVSRYEETQILGINLQWDDTDQGIRLLEALLDTAEDTMQSTLGLGKLNVIDGPDVYYASTGGGRAFLKSSGIMGIIGALIGLGMVVLELILRPTLLDLKDVEKILKLETVGVIPQDEDYFRNRTDLLVKSEEDETSEVEQHYSSTAHILRNIMGTKNKRNCFYVTSAGDGEGKSTVAANLAIQISDMGRRVLLVDLDTRKPSLGGLFLNAVDYSRSLNALYRGEATEREAINSLTGTLDFLPLVLERGGIMLDDTLLEMIERISADYQYVIIDAPPIGKNADVLNLNRIAHMALFVVHHDMSTVQDILAAIRTMDKSGIRILGCIVNGYQAIELAGFFGNGKKKPQQKKKKRRKSADKEHTAEINEMVTRDDEEEDGGEHGSLRKAARSVEGDILAEVAGDDIEEDQMGTEDVLEALVRMGADGSWKKHGASGGRSRGRIWNDLDGQVGHLNESMGKNPGAAMNENLAEGPVEDRDDNLAEVLEEGRREDPAGTLEEGRREDPAETLEEGRRENPVGALEESRREEPAEALEEGRREEPAGVLEEDQKKDPAEARNTGLDKKTDGVEIKRGKKRKTILERRKRHE